MESTTVSKSAPEVLFEVRNGEIVVDKLDQVKSAPTVETIIPAKPLPRVRKRPDGALIEMQPKQHFLMLKVAADGTQSVHELVTAEAGSEKLDMRFDSAQWQACEVANDEQADPPMFALYEIAAVVLKRKTLPKVEQRWVTIETNDLDEIRKADELHAIATGAAQGGASC